MRFAKEAAVAAAGTAVVGAVVGAWMLRRRLRQNRFGSTSKRTKNPTDFVLDNVILSLRTDAAYRRYMDEMLVTNSAYVFEKPCTTYEEFQLELYKSLGGDLRHKPDYEAVVGMLVNVSNGHYAASLWRLPGFLVSFIRMRNNGLGVMANTMHMLTLHATSIGGYLAATLDEDFVTVLKKVRIVRENTGYLRGEKIMFARVRNPFLGTRLCPLFRRHEKLAFPPVADSHNFLSLRDYGNALGVAGTNPDEHRLDGRPLSSYEFMTNDNYWTQRFPDEVFECPAGHAAAREPEAEPEVAAKGAGACPFAVAGPAPLSAAA